jgi:hypothetical protein
LGDLAPASLSQQQTIHVVLEDHPLHLVWPISTTSTPVLQAVTVPFSTAAFEAASLIPYASDLPHESVKPRMLTDCSDQDIEHDVSGDPPSRRR